MKHVLLPSYPYQFPANNTEDPDPYEPIVPIGLSTRTRILLPHSLTSAYFRRLDIPALISYPDDPDSIKPGKKQIKIMKAISLIKKFMNPRFTMAFRGSPWITLDHPASWNRLLKRFKDDNINTFADILSM